MNTTDTICAIATGVGGAVAIIRLAGPDALAILNRVWQGREPLDAQHARLMRLGVVRAIKDHALAVYMPGPHSYTGDDVAELQCHGGSLTARRTLEACLAAGARLAEPGEFTFRSFVNGKMDLTQAEAVADVVAAASDTALTLAENQLSGALSGTLSKIRTKLLDIQGDVESRLDFPEEHIDWMSGVELNAVLAQLITGLSDLANTMSAGQVYRQGVKLVLAGRPNVGKSSLLNTLLGRNRAIVSDIPGTTRDTLEEYATLRNIPVHLTDTAGIREQAGEIEALGIERSQHSLRTGAVIFWLLDAANPDLSGEVEYAKQSLKNLLGRIITVWNKCDSTQEQVLPETGFDTVQISVKQNWRIDKLLDWFEQAVWQSSSPAGDLQVAVNERQRAALEKSIASVAAAMPEIANECWELAAVHLRTAIVELGGITGETAAVDVLDNIFSRFCIGK